MSLISLPVISLFKFTGYRRRRNEFSQVSNLFLNFKPTLPCWRAAITSKAFLILHSHGNSPRCHLCCLECIHSSSCLIWCAAHTKYWVITPKPCHRKVPDLNCSCLLHKKCLPKRVGLIIFLARLLVIVFFFMDWAQAWSQGGSDGNRHAARLNKEITAHSYFG